MRTAAITPDPEACLACPGGSFRWFYLSAPDQPSSNGANPEGPEFNVRFGNRRDGWSCLLHPSAPARA